MSILEEINKQFSIGEVRDKVTTASEYVEIYIFSTRLADYYQQFGGKRFFEQLTDHQLTSLDRYIIHQPIFINRQAALQYARCIDDKHLIFKAYVPESFVIGQPHALALRKHSLKQEHIQGVFLGWVKNTRYFHNPLTTA